MITKKIKKFKIKGMIKDSEFEQLSFGRQLDYYPIIHKFKKESRDIHLSQKRQSYKTAIREAIKLYNVKEYYCEFYCSDDYKDDSFQFWYK
jgi:hypothetical protein